MMCGRTVVGTAVGGVPEALENCGMVVEPRNPQAMADACLHLLQNPSLAKSLGQQAREIAVSEFSLEQCTTSYGRVYQQLSSLRRPQIYRNRDVQSKVFA
jgi:glycosyltransferase involved in cell wall biosynthesis